MARLIRPECLKCHRKMYTLGDGREDSQSWLCVKCETTITIPLTYRWPQ